MRPSRRGLVAAGIGIGLSAGAWWVLRAPPLPVDAAEVRRGALVVTIDEEGETRVRDRFTVAAPTSGRLARIELDAGDPVEALGVVARIAPAPLDPRDLAGARARLEAAEATRQAADARMRRAQAALDQARRDAARAERLHRAGTLATDAREQAKLAETSAVQELDAARFAADAALHDVDAARAVLLASANPSARPSPSEDALPCAGGAPCVEVRAPVAGRVLRVFEESERIVAAGTPLLEIGDPVSLEIVVDVLSADAVRVAPGARFLVEDWGGPGALEARVRRVEPSAFTKVSALGVEEQRVNVIADLQAPEPRLGDRYRVESRIVVWEGADVVQVPASALFRSGEGWSVFVIEDGVSRRRAVRIGHQGAFDAEVVEGLEPGETVILHPSDRVADGIRVATRARP
jgi:HlyD family secretion protein